LLEAGIGSGLCFEDQRSVVALLDRDRVRSETLHPQPVTVLGFQQLDCRVEAVETVAEAV
jgi:hypothetical protein